MTETPISFKSEELAIDGRLSIADANRGVVITHPHPLFGGDMNNPVVQSIKTVYQRKGYTTLRFNFRGVGRSEGGYDEGRGEKKDLLAAVAFLKDKGVQAIDLAGYSFGTWINAAAADAVSAHAMIMVSPPVGMLEFDKKATFDTLKLVVTGSGDEFAPPRLVKPLVRDWNPDAALHVIDGADHFFFSHLRELEEILCGHLG
ncbi:MAG: alpha/beta hydrolase [Desulfobacterales bacterium]